MTRVVGRLAPSPTGYLHLGHARTFLLAYWSVRQQGGKLVLRLEDLDAERSNQHFVDETLRDLEWLGLEWDGQPRLQSHGLARIAERGVWLCQQGFAFPCTCTKADIRAALSAPQQGQSELRYSGHCRGRYRTPAEAEHAQRKGATLRLLVEPGQVAVEDRFVGAICCDVSSECGDFVIVRRDHIPSYQLAVVVDDAEDEVTEVVRGEDLLSSAARQQLLQRRLGLTTPVWYHVPLVVDACGRRLAKRTDALGLRTLRERGCSAQSIVGWIARHSGWPEIDRASAAELVPSFAWDRVPRTKLWLPADVGAELDF